MGFNKKFFTTGGIVASSPAAAAFDPLQNFETVTYTGNGGTQKITGYIRKGAAFGSSTNSQITLPNSIDSDLTASVSFWFKLSELQTNGTFLFYFTRNGWGFNAYVAQDRTLILQACRQSDSTVIAYTSSASYIVLGDWYHICLTRSTNEAKYYINGSLVQTDSYDGTRKSNNYPNSIGNFNSASYETRGVIDQFRVFNTALNLTQVGQLADEEYGDAKNSVTDFFGNGTGVALYELDEDANSSNFEQAAAFNDSDSKITTTYPLNHSNAFSISLWARQETLQDVCVFVGTDTTSGSNRGFQFRTDEFFDGTTAHSYTNPLTAGQWHNMVLVYNGSNNVKIYRDGSVYQNLTSTLGTDTINLIIGNLPASNSLGFGGKIDQVRIYSSELSSTDVEKLYEESSQIPTSTLVAHYKLDGDAEDVLDTYDGTASNVTYSAGVYGGTPTNVNFLGMAFQPDLVWIKNRDATHNHVLFDSVRGDGNSNGYYDRIMSNTADAQQDTTTDAVSSLDSNGFTVVSAGSGSQVNNTDDDYVTWCWRASATTVTDSSTGDITADIRANQDAGFSIVKYTGNSSTNQTIPHGLSSTPEFIIIKNLDDGTANWLVAGENINYYLNLNRDEADPSSSSYNWITNRGADTFTVGSQRKEINQPNEDFITYCFHSVDGYQKVGSYTGTSTTNSFTGFGFQPRWIMIKRTDSTGNWWVFDNVRGNNKGIRVNLNSTEDTTDADANTYEYRINFLLDGFQYEIDNSTSAHPDLNASGGATYIYLAIA
jgi:hypothetical protein